MSAMTTSRIHEGESVDLSVLFFGSWFPQRGRTGNWFPGTVGN